MVDYITIDVQNKGTSRTGWLKGWFSYGWFANVNNWFTVEVNEQ